MDDFTRQMGKARIVKQRLEKAWLRLEGVVSVGVGLSPASTPVIIIGLKEKSVKITQRIPAQVDGIPVLLVQTGDIKAS